MKCDKCGKFMAKDGEEWMERDSIYEPPLSPFIYQNWKCKCGNWKIEVVWDRSKLAGE